jgi:hypothetical protein
VRSGIEEAHSEKYVLLTRHKYHSDDDGITQAVRSNTKYEMLAHGHHRTPWVP